MNCTPRIQVIVFDFDGTLIDSNQIKRDAFFDLFPSGGLHDPIIEGVLAESLEESRFVILRKILCQINDGVSSAREVDAQIERLARKYDVIVVGGAKHCDEKPGATEALESLSVSHRLYMSSTTPEESLISIVKYRGWDRYFCDVFGYPRNKVSTLLKIIRKEMISPNEILVVGDGESDKTSADETGCRFFSIYEDGLLENLTTELQNG